MKAEELKKLYQVYAQVFESLVRRKWKWEAGQKTKARQGFVKFCRTAVIDECDFDDRLKVYRRYLEEAARAWIKWQESSRHNYLGYMVNDDRQSVWIARLLFDDTSPTNQAKDDWEW